MSKIRVLADHVANQIAAGEVVERPASVAKELVENSIDAGATRITIEIEAGGRRLLKVSDDGEGMVRDDAILAFERHATSKIRETDDLAAIDIEQVFQKLLAEDLVSAFAQILCGRRTHHFPAVIHKRERDLRVGQRVMRDEVREVKSFSRFRA